MLRFLLLCITGWLDRREREALAYLVEGNRLLRRQIGGRRLRFTDDDRRRLAMRAHRLGRAALRDLATVVTPDTLLRWHGQLAILSGIIKVSETRSSTALRPAAWVPFTAALAWVAC